MRLAILSLFFILFSGMAGCLGDDPQDRALAYLADQFESGESANGLALAASAVGRDLSTWPTAEDPVLGHVVVYEGTGIGAQARLGLALGRAGLDADQVSRAQIRQYILDEHDGEQFGSDGTFLDDALAVQALLAIGLNKPSDEIIHRSTNLIVSLQNDDGGWHWDGTGSSRPDETGFALATLRDAGVLTNDVRASALEYLESAMAVDGSYAYFDAPNCISSGWAVVSWHALGEPVPEALGDYVLSCQNDDGGFPVFKGGPSDLMATTQMMEALAVL